MRARSSPIVTLVAFRDEWPGSPSGNGKRRGSGAEYLVGLLLCEVRLDAGLGNVAELRPRCVGLLAERIVLNVVPGAGAADLAVFEVIPARARIRVGDRIGVFVAFDDGYALVLSAFVFRGAGGVGAARVARIRHVREVRVRDEVGALLRAAVIGAPLRSKANRAAAVRSRHDVRAAGVVAEARYALEGLVTDLNVGRLWRDGGLVVEPDAAELSPEIRDVVRLAVDDVVVLRVNAVVRTSTDRLRIRFEQRSDSVGIAVFLVTPEDEVDFWVHEHGAAVVLEKAAAAAAAVGNDRASGVVRRQVTQNVRRSGLSGRRRARCGREPARSAADECKRCREPQCHAEQSGAPLRFSSCSFLRFTRPAYLRRFPGYSSGKATGWTTELEGANVYGSGIGPGWGNGPGHGIGNGPGSGPGPGWASSPLTRAPARSTSCAVTSTSTPFPRTESVVEIWPPRAFCAVTRSAPSCSHFTDSPSPSSSVWPRAMERGCP